MLASASSSDIPLWLWLLVTAGTGILAAGVGTYPWWKEHKTSTLKAEGHQREQDRRIFETCNAVLGQEADPTVGRYKRIPGLVEIVPDIQATIGAKNGKSVMEHISDIEAHLKMGQHR